MALVIIETKEVIEDGVTYTINTYSNGAVVKTAKPSDVPVEPVTPEPTTEPTLTETEQAILDTAINVDYLVCMKELEI